MWETPIMNQNLVKIMAIGRRFLLEMQLVIGN